MDWCGVCKYNPPDYFSPDKPCGDCWVYGEGNEPTKFVEINNRQTNADHIRAMTDDELAEFLQKNRGGCRALTTESYVCDFYMDDLNTDCKSCWLD